MSYIEIIMIKKKYIIITGANGYLSQHFSKELCEKYNLILWDIKFNREFLIKIKKFAKEKNSDLIVMKVDITKNERIKKSIEILYKKKLDIYGLINCAGLNPQPNINHPDYFKNYKSFIQMWNEEINISLKGYMTMIYEFSKLLKKSKNSCIINFSSDLGIISPNQNIYPKKIVKPLVYSITKHGIIGMTKYFATLFSEKGIRVNCICFGGVFNKKFNKDFVKKVSKLVPMQRMCKIDEILSPIKFLLDNKNSYMTGHSLVVDGGRTIW